MKKENAAIVIVLVALAFLGIFYFFLAQDVVQLQPLQDTAQTESKVTVPVHVASANVNFISPIFGPSVLEFPQVNGAVNDHPALGNDFLSGETAYSVISESNVPVVICVFADGNLIDLVAGVNTIPLANQKYAFSTLSPSDPSITAAQSFTTSAVETATLNPGQSVYYRFWLTVPVGTPPGVYANVLSFVASDASQGCPTN